MRKLYLATRLKLYWRLHESRKCVVPVVATVVVIMMPRWRSRPRGRWPNSTATPLVYSAMRPYSLFQQLIPSRAPSSRLILIVLKQDELKVPHRLRSGSEVQVASISRQIVAVNGIIMQILSPRFPDARFALVHLVRPRIAPHELIQRH
jgi:hypothetical protein